MEKFWSIKKVIYAIFKTSFPIFIISWWNSNGFPKHFSPLHLPFIGLGQKSSPARDIEGLLFRWFYCSKGAIFHKASCKAFAIFQRTGCIFDLYEEAVHGIILPLYFLFFSAI